jgi:hypothetical protein
MNERIRELRRQATLVETYTANDGSVHEGKSVDLEKFAELIVRECIEAMRLVPYESDREFGDEVIYQEAVKKHFGVEE